MLHYTKILAAQKGYCLSQNKEASPLSPTYQSILPAAFLARQEPIGRF